jgi:1-acyl-sn-glycerol-3-phosphate acyltransferase
MSAMRMFPPIMRDGSKRAFNMWAIDRCVQELRTPGTIVGIHPEGTRNKGDDPYSYLPAQPGAGKVALEANDIPTIPIFVTGMGNSLPREFARNWRPGEKRPIDVYFGDPIDFTDLLPKKHKTTTAKKAAERCVSAIAALGREQRAYREAEAATHPPGARSAP